MFENIIGNEKIKNYLKNIVDAKKVSHSYLFIGTSGIGKKMVANEFAQMILCQQEKEKYCGKCKSCIEFGTSNNPDFSYIEPIEGSIKIEQIRELQRRVQEKPIIAKRKVYIIDDADLMTSQAQNCLLKTLEEPPEFVTIILIGSNENSFLQTIKSRCIILHFDLIADEKIKEILYQEGIQNISQNFLDLCQGSIGKALILKDKQEEYKKIEDIFIGIDKRDLIDIINSSELIYKARDEIFEILDYINVILLKFARTNYKYANCIEIVENTKQRLKQNANYDMTIDNMLFNIWEEVN